MIVALLVVTFLTFSFFPSPSIPPPTAIMTLILHLYMIFLDFSHFSVLLSPIWYFHPPIHAVSLEDDSIFTVLHVCSFSSIFANIMRSMVEFEL